MKKVCLFFILLTGCFSYLIAVEEKPMVVVVPSYKNARWFELNLFSIISQEYENFRVIYIDDCSPDATGDLVEEFLKDQKVEFIVRSFDDSGLSILEATKKFSGLVNEDRYNFVLIKNVNRCGAFANLYRAIHSCLNEEIIVTVDGDDWLYDTAILKTLNKVYTENSIWLTHGRIIEHPHGATHWCIPVPEDIIVANKFREYRCPSHLRTFYAWLFKEIQLEDLLYESNFFSMTWDQAMMFPMIEMAGERHQYISDINYVYNMENSINDNKVDPGLQVLLEKYIRAKTPYKRLEKSKIKR